jgi:hypothetical protein
MTSLWQGLNSSWVSRKISRIAWTRHPSRLQKNTNVAVASKHVLKCVDWTRSNWQNLLEKFKKITCIVFIWIYSTKGTLSARIEMRMWVMWVMWLMGHSTCSEKFCVGQGTACSTNEQVFLLKLIWVNQERTRKNNHANKRRRIFELTHLYSEILLLSQKKNFISKFPLFFVIIFDRIRLRTPFQLMEN